jgi:serine/threonine-protein kinase
MGAPDDDKRASRYDLLVKIASGGMATVYVGRLKSVVGFWRLVAIKRAHPHLAENPSFRDMLIEEARLASRLHHANVVSVLDVEELGSGELRLVMDYIEGASLAELTQRPMPPALAIRVALDACAGLQSAHELRDDAGNPVGLVHRDVSPHNVLVGIDGTARLSDFGIAKVPSSGIETTTGGLKGKIGYMAPEYIDRGTLDARSDVFSMGVVVWEALAGRKLFRGNNEVDTLKLIVGSDAPRLSSYAPWASRQLDAVLASALARDPEQRFVSAKAFAAALESAAQQSGLLGSHADVAAHVRAMVGDALDKRRAQLRERLSAAERETAKPGTLEPVRLPNGLPPSDNTSTIARGTVSRPVNGVTGDESIVLPTTKRGFGYAIAALVAAVLGVVIWLSLAPRTAGTNEPSARPQATSVVSAEPSAPPAIAVAPSASAPPVIAVAPAASSAASPRTTTPRPRASASSEPSVKPNPY